MYTMKTKIKITTLVNASKEKVWRYWTEPKHIIKWNNASEDWHTPKAENDFTVGGKFVYTMASKDGSMSFDFGGTYNEIETNEKIVYTIDDNRIVEILFESTDNQIKITETFEAETQNPIEMQQTGWQAILDNFKNYTENN
ncbi:polyketide cyclase [Flavobacterium sp. 316]|nr:polyketide cyclase [Flavobacterium sp. 316]